MLELEFNQGGRSGLSSLLIKKLARLISRELALKKPLKISAALVNASAMKKLNTLYRHRPKVTDVLAFPFGQPGHQVDEAVIGEVIICYEQAAKQAKAAGHAVRREIVFLLIHGILHLFDFDHMKPKEAAEMFTLQERILNKFFQTL